MGDTNGAAAAAAEVGMEGQNSAESSGTSTISRRTGAHGEERLQVRV